MGLVGQLLLMDGIDGMWFRFDAAIAGEWNGFGSVSHWDDFTIVWDTVVIDFY